MAALPLPTRFKTMRATLQIYAVTCSRHNAVVGRICCWHPDSHSQLTSIGGLCSAAETDIVLASFTGTSRC